jgi:RNA polymerase sigma factor (sigma-70 family)
MTEIEGRQPLRATAGSDSRAGALDRGVQFERLTQQRLNRAYRFATVILDDDVEAEDAVHDAAVRAWSCWGSLRDVARFDAWFDRIVVNICRDRLRRRKVRRSEPLHDLADRPAEGTEIERLTETAALLRAVDGLGFEHRTVVVLRFLEGMTVAEIASRTGSREGTVKSRLHYAIRRLRAALDEEGDE